MFFEKPREIFPADGFQTAISNTLSFLDISMCLRSTDRHPSNCFLKIPEQFIVTLRLGNATGNCGYFRPVSALFRFVHDDFKFHGFYPEMAPRSTF